MSRDNIIDFNLLSLNVRGLTDHTRRRKLFTWLRDLNVNIVALQETYCTVKNQTYFNSSWGGKVFHSLTNSSHSRGVAILFSKTFKGNYLNSHSSADGRIVLVNFEIEEQQYSIVNIYAPNVEKDRSEFFKKVNKWINQYSINVDNNIIVGDFNCCLNNQDRSPQTHLNDKSRKCLKKICKNLKIIDCWNKIHSGLAGYTYFDRVNNTKSRLDYIFTSEKLTLELSNIQLKKAIKGDHLAIFATFRQTIKKRGKGY